MSRGAWSKFYVKNVSISAFLKSYEEILKDLDFSVVARHLDGNIVYMKSIWGDPRRAILVSEMVPMGSWLKSGNRYGTEIEARQDDDDVLSRILVMPYMRIFDDTDEYLLKQDIVERFAKDFHSNEIKKEFLKRLKQRGLDIIIR
jgi:hypothetical protein